MDKNPGKEEEVRPESRVKNPGKEETGDEMTEQKEKQAQEMMGSQGSEQKRKQAPEQQKYTLQVLPERFSVCKVKDYTAVDVDRPFVFTGRTDEEKSLVCPVSAVPENTVARDDGWRAFRITGELDFSLIGILAELTRVLAEAKIGIFAISTFNTDYVLVKGQNYERALEALRNSGYDLSVEKSCREL